MARLFAAASSQNASVASTPMSTTPCTMACWFKKTTDQASTAYLISINESAATNAELALRITTSPHNLVATARASGSSVVVNSSSGTSADVWYHGAAVFASSTSRTVYLNATGNSATDGANATGLGIVTVGSNNRASSPGAYFDGAMAHVAIWNVALSSAEIAQLYNSGIGLDPRSVRPDKLAAYWPLLNNDGDQDYWGNFHLTASGSPTYAQHPPVLMRSRPKYVILGAGAPSIATIEIAGTRQVGNTLTCNATSSPSGATFTYQWYMADDIAGTNQTAISGATAQTYELSYANIGAATKLYEGLDANGEAFIACGATPTKDAVEGDETVSSYVSITEAAATAPVGSPFESAYIR